MIFGVLRIKWNTQKSAVVSSILFINFIVFGNIRSFLTNDLQFNFEYLTVALLIIFLIIVISSIFFIFRKNILNEISKIFTIFSLSLILILMPNILFFYIDNDKENTELFEINLDVEMSSKPDVYVVIMDEFAGELQLASDFDYYPEKFFEELELRDFNIPKFAFSNYPNTAYSIPSIMNMDYVDFIPEILGEESTNTLMANELADNNNVMKMFHNNGYHVVSFYGGMGALGKSFVDQKVCAPFEINNDLKEKYLQIYVPFTNVNNQLINGTINDKLQCILENVSNTSTGDKPHVYFIHLRLPHEPFVYDANGTYNELSNYDATSKEGYLEQLKYSEKFVLKLSDMIKENNPESAILVFSDHGFRAEIDWENRQLDNMIRGNNVITAIHIPGENVDLPETVTLVNLFRIFFNQYLENDFEVLDDRIMWYNPIQPNKHYDVTEEFSEYIK
tara:strand:- start:22940 stop:24286 length:1347 start_codon:yes stop_codon:yes gene_type:complete